MSAPRDAPVELHDAICLALVGGGVCSVGGASSYVGADGNKHHLAVEAVGREGQFHVDVFRERFSRFRPDTGQTDLDVTPGEGAYDGARAAHRLVDLALGRTQDNPAPGELGARAVEALELAYRSAATGAFATAP
jgi:predicted dehydrogenase